jgi:hypothetical protein
MWQFVQLADTAELVYRSGKEYTKYSSLFKGKWLGDSTKHQLRIFDKKETADGEWEIMVQGINKRFIRMCYRGLDGHCLGHFCIYI